jgi:dihydroflavonol-4-reductase
MPYRGALAVGVACELLARVTGREPAVSATAVRMAAKRMFFDPAKAIGELGLPQTPPEAALRDAVDWFWAHGYAPQRRREG